MMPDTHRTVHQLTDKEHTDLARRVMRRQATLSLRVGAVFALLVFGLPLVNYYRPVEANTSELGFTATWLFLGILFFPITWVLSAYFIRESDRIEKECADWRAVLGVAAGEPLEPAGVGDVHPAFIEDAVSDKSASLNGDSK